MIIARYNFSQGAKNVFKTIHSFFFALSFVLFFSEAKAQNSSTACNNIQSITAAGGTPSSGTFASCLQHLQDQIAQLQSQQGLSAGFVIAYAGQASSTSNPCPVGFSLYTPARDKMIVGAGNKHGQFSTGGAEKVTLTTDNIPRHQHRVSGSSKSAATQSDFLGGSTAAFGLDKSFQSGNTRIGITEFVGRGVAHENMPPYVALFYCKKD